MNFSFDVRIHKKVLADEQVHGGDRIGYVVDLLRTILTEEAEAKNAGDDGSFVLHSDSNLVINFTYINDLQAGSDV